MLNHPNFGLSKSLEEVPYVEKYANPLPRAVIRPNSFILLDGEWRFSLDLKDRGLNENWQLGHVYPFIAIWPGTVEEHIEKISETLPPFEMPKETIAWYEREFPLPVKTGHAASSILQLTFGACGFATTVWCNGKLMRTIENEEVHYGEYTSFSYELGEDVLLPVNRLTVRIADTLDADIPRGKQESHVYKRGGIWYHTHSGAVRSVWLETVERNRLRSRVGVVSEVDDQLVRFNLTLLVHDPGDYVLRLKVYDREGLNATPLATSDFSMTMEAGQKQQRVVMELPETKTWSPESPHLYRLVAQLTDKDGYAAEIETYFGLRKIEARGRFIYLNNTPVYLDGILYQPGSATYEQMRAHMHAMKALGCNLVRIHIAGVDPRIYKLADEMGLLLWVEVPSPHSSNYRSRANHFAELVRMLALIETHPSIVIWSLYNEDWGAQDIATNEETRRYIIDTYHYMKINHPQFLVVDNDGWQHVSLEGRLKSDLLTVHLYTPEITRWHELLERLAQGDLQHVAAFPLTVGDPYFYRHQVPMVVSEWGGFGFVNYGGPGEAGVRAEQIRLFKEELRKWPITGDVYTQATNIEDERNGLIDPVTGDLTVPAGLLESGNKGEN